MANALITSAILKHYSSSLTSSSVDEKSANIHSHEIVPLTIFDKATHDCHEDVYLVFKPPMPSNEVLKDALSKVLVYYPHLAGRFVTDNLGRTCIILNNAGVRITETYIPTTLAEQLPFDASKDGSHLIPSVKGVEELCQVQLNRYKCSGLVLGFTAHHRVADGQSILGSFFVSWSRMVRGLTIELAPYHDRYAISQPRNPPRVEFEHGSIEFQKSTINLDNTVVFSSSSVETVIVNYSVEFINKIKDMVSNNQDQRYSTFVCLLSHVWKKVTQARGLGLEESSQVRIAVNGRQRISEPAVPMEYFGNLVLWAYPRLKVKELVNESCAYIAKSIRDEVNRVNDRYFKSFIDFGATILQSGGDSDESDELQQTTPEFGSSLCPNLEADSWLRFQVQDIDFGSGGPCAIFPPSIPFEGLVVFIPAGTEDGGVDVKLTLFSEHARLFKKIAHFVDGKLTPTEIAF
ncbi:hypothetical protein C5167_008357 [Papaver somniferum]|uniref:Uncharacterized protein n=1 Tax=Papaver somniferum TaxID=3469 RepID=A0A4Y7JY12_PAPSO|nr:tryptamine hydroxycinnamoyltransferase 1-like [Papaver somniferum]RZC64668.1 hypothetical protein C5167_008357 [Papaver somniferum]